MVKNNLFKQNIAFIIVYLFLGTCFIPIVNGSYEKIKDENNKLDYQTISSIINESLLDLQYIYNITEDLSNIIFTEYDESSGEIAKGRDFGTKGERKAADILFENLTSLGIYSWKEKMSNTPETISDIPKKIASKVEIMEKSLVIKKISDWSLTPISECYFSSRWNLTAGPIYPKTAKLISSLCPVNGTLDKKFHLYNEERLTNNFSYTNVKIIRKPYLYSLPIEILRKYVNDEPFVYIDKDIDYCGWDEPKKELKFIGPIFKNIFQEIDLNEQILWLLFQPNCKGLIIYDSNNDTFNGGPGIYQPLPIIKINGSIGKKLYENPDDYRIDFYMNQQWNESVESYNVIGQINGTNPDETVIISCLYDCQWNQGTADSAIGMAVVLGIAKYIKDQNIMPKCNVRFIAFCGEEHGLRGAYYYEALHRNENITTVIDLNQLGFNWTKTRLTLAFYTNYESLNSTISDITSRTDYVNRTGNITNFTTEFRGDGGPPSNARVFAIAKEKINRSYNTILIVKKGPWYFHHKDGLNHQEGDVIKYFDWLDTSVTGEMAWNVTKYFIVDN